MTFLGWNYWPTLLRNTYIEQVLQDTEYLHRFCGTDTTSFSKLCQHKNDLNQFVKVVSNGICNVLLDKAEENYNIIGGRRFTFGVPNNASVKIHMFGPCVVMGLCVADEMTICSILQKLINHKGYSAEVVNHGLAYGNDQLNDLLGMMDEPIRKGDCVIWFSSFEDDELQKLSERGIPIISVRECVKDLNDWFLDNPFHCNAAANQNIAKAVFHQINKLHCDLSDRKRYSMIESLSLNLHHNPYAILDNCRYLFLLSSDYFDKLEGDERGNIEIIDKTEFKKRAKSQGYIENQIVINDIQEAVNNKASEIYTEISVKNEEFKNTLEKLKEDYLLSDEALSEVSLGDSLDDVFKKAYNYDAKLMASQTASYEKSIQSLESLNPASETYQEHLSNIVNDFVKSLPLQNRATLSKYVARRKMVIELMGKILKRMTEAQETAKRNEDEKLLHNLIFKQHSENPLNSDLWLINEEYMYFKGTSESQLSKVTIDGKKVFKNDFDAEEQRYLTSLGENRMKMRTDVLLFPSEGKCVIIEFKNPDVNVSDCLNQITKYAYFLRNFTKPEFKFVTFYGYLIGESVEKRDVRSADGDFIAAPNLDYIFRPRKNIPDDSGTNIDGSLYMEVLKFSVLKERAEIRNKAFIDRILGDNICITNVE